MRRSLVALFVALVSPAAVAVAQASRMLAPGVYLLPLATESNRNAGWIDLGADVLAIVPRTDHGDDAIVQRIRQASGKPVRAVFTPNGAASSAGPSSLVPASRGPGGGVAFKGTLTIGGARRVEIRELERAVSAGNGIVYVPDAGVLFTGDLLGDQAQVDSARTDAWIVVLDRLRRLEPRIVVPGSGAVGGPELLDLARKALVAVRASVRQGVTDGRSIEAIVAALPTEAGGGARAVLAQRIYREMVGLAPPPMIDELDLRPGTSPTSKTPGWTKPTAILVRDLWPDKPGRVAELRYVAPGVEIRVAKTPEEAASLAPGADASLGWLSPAVLARGDRLRWIQSPSAGVEGILAVPGFAENPITLTNAQRIYGPPIAEHVFGLLLGLTRGVNVAVPLMKESRWNQEAFSSPSMPELRGKTMLVVGLGGIGTEVAALAHGFGMRVIATRATKGTPTDIVEYVGGSNELATLVREADVVVDCLPLTRATEKAFSAEVLAAMKPTAYLVNIGRGRTLDTDALVKALAEKRIAGAGLDVTEPEPLPAGHPLWAFPNVVITPHVASNSDAERERTWLLFRENVRRFANGEPLLSVVDKKAGY